MNQRARVASLDVHIVSASGQRSSEASTADVNASEPSGASHPYSFSDGPPRSSPPWQTWVAPDGHEAVQYQTGGLPHLQVLE